MCQGLTYHFPKNVPGLSTAGFAHDEGAFEGIDTIDDAGAALVPEGVVGKEVDAVGCGEATFFLRKGFVIAVEDVGMGPADAGDKVFKNMI